MNDKEILEKYKKEIDTDIQRYYQENGIKQDIEKEEFVQKYKANFVKGFYEGCNKASIKVAINMLNQKLDDKFISSVTGLSLEEILKLKSTN